MSRFKKSAVFFMLFALVLGLCKFTVYAEEKDYVITSAYWDESLDNVIALWDEAADKTSYRIQLYKGNKKIGALHTVSSDKYNFSRQIADNGSGTYYFTIYPTKGGRNLTVKSEPLLVESDYLNKLKEKYKNGGGNTGNARSGPGVQPISPETTFNPALGNRGWNQTGTQQWWWKFDDGNYAKGTWLLLNDKWYYFNADGLMHTGWLKYKELWYYLSQNGDMLTNASTPDGFNVNADGVWVP